MKIEKKEDAQQYTVEQQKLIDGLELTTLFQYFKDTFGTEQVFYEKAETQKKEY